MRTLFKHSNIYETHTVGQERSRGTEMHRNRAPSRLEVPSLEEREEVGISATATAKARTHPGIWGFGGWVALVPLEGRWGAGGRAQGKNGGG